MWQITGPGSMDDGVNVDHETDDFEPKVTITSRSNEDGYTCCARCGRQISEYVDGWQAEDGPDVERCSEHDDYADDDMPAPHEAPTGPASWLNSASADINGNVVQVNISVGSPLGAFQMSVERMADGTLILHVPHPDAQLLHMPLTELHPGTYRIG